MTRRRRPVQRLTSALVGALITTIGTLALISLSGYSIDLELVFIIVLGAAGVWLLATALLGAGRRDASPIDAPAEPVHVSAARERAESVRSVDD